MPTIRVRVPCSSSNLGAGFDCIGLALNRYLTATLQTADSPIRIERTGTLASAVDEDDDLVVAAMRHMRVEPRGSLKLESDIPVGRGLGSSAAATVAGIMLAAKLTDSELDRGDIASHATFLEGHPDNAVPATFGGLMAAVTEETGGVQQVRVHRLRLSSRLRFVYAAPHAIVATKAARRALPEHVTHKTAANAIGRAVALLEGLADADPALLRLGFSDELHVPYRLPMIPGGESALRAAEAAGAFAATISGSGSGLIAVCAEGAQNGVSLAMRKAFEQATAADAIAFVAEVDDEGAQYIVA
jgi:homoserine kinase